MPLAQAKLTGQGGEADGLRAVLRQPLVGPGQEAREVDSREPGQGGAQLAEIDRLPEVVGNLQFPPSPYPARWQCHRVGCREPQRTRRTSLRPPALQVARSQSVREGASTKLPLSTW